MKSFDEQKYTCTIKVQITFEDSNDIYTDEIKGLNPGHALYLARLNWPDASAIEITQ